MAAFRHIRTRMMVVYLSLLVVLFAVYRGTRLAQGHHLSPPLEAGDFDVWLTEREA
jgi:hypothetical protein